MSRRQRWFNHPLIVIPPFVLALALVWQQHTLSGRSLNLPLQNANLLALASSTMPTTAGLPTGWSLAHSGSSNSHASQTGGYVNDSATMITVTDYASGDIRLLTPTVALKPDQAYLFKGYYAADAPFSLVVRYIYNDGTEQFIHINDYPGQKGTWSTAAHAFHTKNQIASAQFIFTLASKGHLTVDGVYLEQRNNIYIPPPHPTGPNTIPNSTLAATAADMPDAWSIYHTGDSQASFATAYDNGSPYLQTSVSNFKNGEAKWQYTPQPVKPHEHYRFSAIYRSDAPVKVVAEYQLSDGGRQFDTLANLMPAGQWTNINFDLEVPDRSQSLNVSLILQTNGTLSSRGYVLTNITKSGPLEWKRPLVSITFDDGWHSTYLNAVPILQRYGYKATFYINPSSIETPGFMYADELSDLAKQHEIAAHGYTHKDMTAINANALENELKQGKDYLTSAGFTITDFAPPYGKSDAEVEWFARKYFTTSRSIDTGINTKQNLDAYNLKTLYLEFNTPPEVVARALSEAASTNGWLILVYHNVGAAEHSSFPSEEPRTSTVSTEAFATNMAQIQKSGLTVLPITAAYEEVSKQ